MDQEIELKNEARQELADSVAAFIMTGGIIEVLPAPWERSKEENKKLIRGHSKNISYSEKTEVSADRAEIIAKVRDLASKFNLTKVSKMLNISRWSLRDIARANRIVFVPTTKAEQTPEQVEADRKQAERICALRDVGLTRRQCYVQMHIGHGRFMALLEKHNIDYPKSDAQTLKRQSQ